MHVDLEVVEGVRNTNDVGDKVEDFLNDYQVGEFPLSELRLNLMNI